jgi:hypothetical protein
MPGVNLHQDGGPAAYPLLYNPGRPVNESTFLGMTINALMIVGGGLLMYRKLAGQVEAMRISPDPLNVRLAGKMVSVDQCEKQHAADQRYLSMRFDQLESRIAELANILEKRNEAGEIRAAGIHKRVDAVASQVAELRGQISNHIEHGDHT